MAVGPIGFEPPVPSSTSTLTASSTASPLSAPVSSTQTCTTACAITISVVLLSLLTLFLISAYFNYRRSNLPTRHNPSPHTLPMRPTTADSSVPSNPHPVSTGHVPDRGTFAQRMRGFFNKYEGPAPTGTVSESGDSRAFSTLRQSVRRDPRTKGYVDLEAGYELGHSRTGSVASETTLAEALAEGKSEERKLGA